MMSIEDYYILDGHEPKVATWQEYVAWIEAGPEQKRVSRTKVGDADVSTVFLMIDHGWGNGPPILFETMIFGGEHDENQWRYATWDAAMAGHKRIVRSLKAGKTP